MSYWRDVEKKLGDVYEKLLDFARKGRMTRDDFKLFAEELKVFGKHKARIEDCGGGWDRRVEIQL